MNREERLKASREENRNVDIAELELARGAQLVAGITSLMTAFALLAFEFLALGEKGYGYLLIGFASNMALWISRAVKQRKKTDIFLVLLWTAMTVYTAVMYVGNVMG